MAVIFYLSGTGNSLYAAQKAAAAFDGCRLETVGGYLAAPYKVRDEVIGIVCPVYCFALPPVMERFLQILDAAPEYCFGIVTMGGNYGRAFAQMQQLLKDKNIKLNYANAAVMPDNFFCTPQDKRPAMLAAADKMLAAITEQLKERKQSLGAVKEAYLWKYGGTATAWWYINSVKKMSDLKVNTASCIGCGVCAEICSMQNIKIENGSPVFGDNCASCLGCVHWCPKSAISAGAISVDADKRYVNPNIKLQEMNLRRAEE